MIPSKSIPKRQGHKAGAFSCARETLHLKKDGNELVTLTDQLLEKTIKTNTGQFTEAQLKLLGITWPPVKGWKKTVIGRRESVSFVHLLYILGIQRAKNGVDDRHDTR